MQTIPSFVVPVANEAAGGSSGLLSLVSSQTLAKQSLIEV